MLKIIVDSASSIKNEEKEQYGVELLPLRVIIDGQEYLDGVNLDLDEFYEKLKTTKEFPKTSLPSLEYASELVEGFLAEGARVLIITLSSGISGTYQVLKALFAEKEDVLVYDS